MSIGLKYICLLISTAVILVAAEAPAQNKKIDSLENILKTAKQDTNKVNALNKLAGELEDIGSFDEAKTQANRSLQLAITLNYMKGMAVAYSEIGIINDYLGDLPESIQNYFLSLRIFEKINNRRGIANVYTNLGSVYEGQLNLMKADSSYQKALSIYISIGDNYGMAAAYHNIANNSFKLDRYSEALYFEILALRINKLINNRTWIALNLNSMGNIYLGEGDLEKALNEYTSALKIDLENGNLNSMAASYNNLGLVSIKMKNFKEAARYLEFALPICKKIKSREELRDTYSGLYLLDSARGEYRSAFDHYKISIAYRDSLNNEESTKRSVRSEMQYAFDKKQTADSIRNGEHTKQENLKHDQEIKQQRLYTYGGVIGFILMLIVAGVSFRAFRNKQKANEIISLQKILVEEKQKEILDSIHYAKRIQQSLLPTEKYIEKNLKRLRE